MTEYFENNVYSCSQDLEFFYLPAVPTEQFDRKRQPQIPMTPHLLALSFSSFSKSLSIASSGRGNWTKGDKLKDNK